MPRFWDGAVSTRSNVVREAQLLQAQAWRQYLPANDVPTGFDHAEVWSEATAQAFWADRVRKDWALPWGVKMHYGDWSGHDTAREAIAARRRVGKTLGAPWTPESARSWARGEAHKVIARSAQAEAKLIAETWRWLEQRSVAFPRWHTVAFDPFAPRSTEQLQSAGEGDASARREAFAQFFHQLSLDAPNAAARALIEEPGERVDDCIRTVWLGSRYMLGERGEVTQRLESRLCKHADEIGTSDDPAIQLTAITTIAALTTVAALSSRTLQIPRNVVGDVADALVDAAEAGDYDVAHAAAATLGLMAHYVLDERVVVQAANVLVATMDLFVYSRKDIGEDANGMIGVLIGRLKNLIPRLPQERYTYNSCVIDSILHGCVFTPNDQDARSMRSLLIENKFISSVSPMVSPMMSTSPSTNAPFVRLLF